jgi:hypothetical protein
MIGPGSPSLIVSDPILDFGEFFHIRPWLFAAAIKGFRPN